MSLRLDPGFDFNASTKANTFVGELDLFINWFRNDTNIAVAGPYFYLNNSSNLTRKLIYTKINLTKADFQNVTSFEISVDVWNNEIIYTVAQIGFINFFL